MDVYVGALVLSETNRLHLALSEIVITGVRKGVVGLVGLVLWVCFVFRCICSLDATSVRFYLL